MGAAVRKRTATRIWPALLIVLAAAGEAAASGRTSVSLNIGWKFTPQDVAGAQKIDLNTTGWESVNIPHTWNDTDPFDDQPGYRRAPAWYRRHFTSRTERNGGRAFLYFEGVNQTARVYVNGQFVGEHVGGYTAFVFDVTDHLKRDGSRNILAVRVDNTRDLDKPPIDGDFNIYGGIYRDVRLITTDEVHLTLADHASSGVTIETPEITGELASVRISGKVANSGSTGRSVEVVNEIVDSRRRKVAAVVTRLIAGAGVETRFEAERLEVDAPRLWSPDDPYLYSVRTIIRLDGRTIDQVSNPLGFRWFRFDPKDGFFLNGKPLKLRGTNRHQDRQGLGNAVPDALQVRDLELIKRDGFNFLRLGHYPQDPAVIQAADRLGLMLWEEIPIVNKIHVSPGFSESAKRMLSEMIRQHRNHPSIVIWGFMNEVFLPVPKTDAEVQATVALAKELERICKTEDPTRATAIAFDHGARELYHSSGLSEVTDVIGWNLYHGWYYQEFSDFGRFMDEEHARHPNRPLILSEYGANGDRRVHSLLPQKFDSTIEWQRRFHEAYLPQIEARRYLAGAAIWNQFDFGSEFRGETIPHVNQKGMYTFDRQAKDIAHFYRAAYSVEPVLHIATRDWLRRSGPAEQNVEIYSNLAEVELVHNGKSLGTKSVIGHKAWWKTSLVNGSNHFVARARRDRKTLFDRATVFYHTPSSTRDIAINCGSNVEYFDADGLIWQAETFDGTRPWSVSAQGSRLTENRGNIIGTIDDQIFQTMREGAASYRLDIPDGDYELELRFAEPRFKETSKRLFRVTVNRTSSPLIDLVREGGFMKAVVKRQRVRVTDGAGIDISLSAVVDQPVISAIRVKRMV